MLNTNWLVHVHTQKHTHKIVPEKYFRKNKQIFSHMGIANIEKKPVQNVFTTDTVLASLNEG